MKNVLTMVGGVTIAVLLIYFIGICPYNKIKALEKSNKRLQQHLYQAEEETRLVYFKYEKALRKHLDSDKLNEIYSDSRYFTKSQTQIQVTR